MSKTGKLFGGIDVGSSSIKTSIIDAGTGKIISARKRRYRGDMLAGNSVQVNEIYSEFIKEIGSLSNEGVTSIGLSCMAPILIPVDSNFESLTAIPYNSLLGSEFFGKNLNFNFRRINFNSPNAQMFPQKILWLRKNSPEVLEEASYIVDLNAYLLGRVCGKHEGTPVQDYPTAVEWGLVDSRKRDWWKPVAEKLGIRAKLPELVEPEFAIDIGDTRLCIGTVDTLVSSLGAIGLDSSLLFVSNGSTLCAGFVSKKPVITDNLYCDAYFSGRYLIDGCNSQFSTVLDFAERLFRTKIDINDVDEKPTEVTFMPYLTGERCPLFNTSLRGGFYGFNAETSIDDIKKSVVHSLAYLTIDMLDAVIKLSGRRREIVVGGGVGGRTIGPIVATVAGMNYNFLNYDPGSVGAALIAMKSSSTIASYPLRTFRYIGGETETYTPDRSLNAHAAAYERFTKLRRKLENF